MFTQIHPHLAMTSMTSSDLWKAEISQFPKSPSPSGAISMKVFFTVTFTSAPGGRPVLSHGEKLKNGPPPFKVRWAYWELPHSTEFADGFPIKISILQNYTGNCLMFLPLKKKNH